MTAATLRDRLYYALFPLRSWLRYRLMAKEPLPMDTWVTISISKRRGQKKPRAVWSDGRKVRRWSR